MPDRDELSITIGTTQFRYFSELKLTRTIDKFDTVSFKCPWDHNDFNQRDLFKPFSYQPVKIHLGELQIFEGTLMNVQPVMTPSSKTVTLTAYARAAVWGDCTLPEDAQPAEFNGLTFDQIVAELAIPFGLTPTYFSIDTGAPFKRVKLETGQTIMSFLIPLAKERGILISNNMNGDPLFQGPLDVGAAPVTSIRENEEPLIGITANFKPQAYFSTVTGVTKTKAGKTGARYTEVNTFLQGENEIPRPNAFTIDDSATADGKRATALKMGRMFGNVATYTAQVATMFDEGGTLWEPNTYIEITAPDVMIYGATKFLIREVAFQPNPASRTATLGLSLLGAFQGQIPGGLPWLQT